MLVGLASFLKAQAKLLSFSGSMFLEWDRELYDPVTDEPAKCNSSDLNEELGQIEILFSDKTGTLTENIMLFKEASISGLQYDSEALSRASSSFSSFTNVTSSSSSGSRNTEGRSELEISAESELHICEFLTALSVCHTVQAETVMGSLIYLHILQLICLP